jgi:hypothetical protein
MTHVIPMHHRPRMPLPDNRSDLDMPEARLLARWLRYCESHGILYFHIYKGDFAKTGLADLILVGNGQHAHVELKSLCGTLSPMQERWKRELQAAGVSYSVHTPLEWANGTSQKLLDTFVEDAEVIELNSRRAA